MRLLLILSAGFVIFNAPANALTLTCEISSRIDQGSFDRGPMASSKVIESWSPKKQIHIINIKENTAIYKGPNFKTKLDVINKNRIKWRYEQEMTDSRKTNYNSVGFEYTYIRKNHKIVSSVDFGPMYMEIVSTKGICVERN
jgi:hypothetical protein